jgi:hypothetical protein
MFLASIRQKVLVSAFIAIISALYQLESNDEFFVTEKLVMLSKNRSEIFNYLTNLEDYPRVNLKCYFLVYIKLLFLLIFYF